MLLIVIYSHSSCHRNSYILLNWNWILHCLQIDCRLTSYWLESDFRMTLEWPETDLRLTPEGLTLDLWLTREWPQIDLRLTWDWPQKGLYLILGLCDWLETDHSMTWTWLQNDYLMTTEWLYNDCLQKISGQKNDYLPTLISRFIVCLDCTKSTWSRLSSKTTFCWLFVDFIMTFIFYWGWPREPSNPLIPHQIPYLGQSRSPMSGYETEPSSGMYKSPFH